MLSIRTLFGAIIRERLSAKIHGANLAHLLEQDNEQILALWEKPCGQYIRAVKSVADAVGVIFCFLIGQLYQLHVKLLRPQGWRRKGGLNQSDKDQIAIRSILPR